MPLEKIDIMKLSYYSILFLFLTILVSCSDDQCNTDTESLLQTECIANDVDQEFIDKLSIYSPEWNDSIHYSEDGADNKIGFVLSPNSDTTEIVYTSADTTLIDTLYIYYQRELTFLSPECGFVINYFIDTVTHTYNIIDSIEVVTKEITTDKNGSVKIYF